MEDRAAVRKYGECITTKYVPSTTIHPLARFPETHSLNLGQTLSSGHGSVSFDSDSDCTAFVHSFFPACEPYLVSCSQVPPRHTLHTLQVKGDPGAAASILGCLFGHYPSLMAPLLQPRNSTRV